MKPKPNEFQIYEGSELKNERLIHVNRLIDCSNYSSSKNVLLVSIIYRIEAVNLF